MIKNIFIPEQIKSYYLLSTTIIGVNITKSFVYATKVVAKGYNRTIIETYQESIGIDKESINYEDNLAQALKSLKTKVGYYDNINISLSDQHIIFKNLMIPFLDESKIKAVLPFEVESLLPFNLNQASIDAIITYENKELKQADILVAALPQKTLNIYLGALKEAELSPDKISVEILELYSIYKYIYLDKKDNKHDKNIALIDLNLHNIKIAIIINGQLKHIRNLNKGIIDIIKDNKNVNINNIENLIQLDIDNNQDIIQDIIDKLQFTINATIKKDNNIETLDSIYLAGIGSDIPNLSDLICKELKIKCSVLNTNMLIHNNNINSQVMPIKNKFLASIATAFPNLLTQNFNLSDVAKEKSNNIKAKQIVVLIALSILILSGFLTYSIIRVQNIKSKNNKYKKEAINRIKKSISIKRGNNLEAINKNASQRINILEASLSNLLTKKGYSLLYLKKLSEIIDKKETGLKVNEITITPNEVKIYGSIKDTGMALATLEKELKQSKLFNLIGSLQTKDFIINPIILTINKQED